MNTKPNSQAKPRHDVGTAEGEIDQILADSFPASDAPPWTLGVLPTPRTQESKEQGKDGSPSTTKLVG